MEELMDLQMDWIVGDEKCGMQVFDKEEGWMHHY
jgi:hypothetical protein